MNWSTASRFATVDLMCLMHCRPVNFAQGMTEVISR